jgi:hypothetical protein
MTDATEPVSLGMTAVAKVDEAQQNVFGWASIVAKADGTVIVDHQGDVIEPAELEGAAYQFMSDSRASGIDHDGQPADGEVIESMVMTVDKARAMGIPDGVMPTGWWLGVHIPDADQFAKAKTGERAFFSIEGTAIREPIA